MSRPLTAADILAADDLAREVVDVPEWGGKVTVRELTVAERGRMVAWAERAPETLPAWLIATCAITADGAPLFPPAELDRTVERLSAKGQAAVKRLADAVFRLSGIDLGGGGAGAAEGN